MKFLTFLNSGCIEICRNMLKSAELVGLDPDNFIIACLDLKSYTALHDYKGAYFYQTATDIPIEYQDWTFDSDSQFRRVVSHKWNIINDWYKTYQKLCWVDTDIVFVKNPLTYIENADKILFQKDYPGSTICSGFMVFNDSVKCRNLINDCVSYIGEDDQLAINGAALNYRHAVGLLDESLFPNGYQYYQVNNRDEAVIVHNNHMIGIETKINAFKSVRLWYV